MLPSGFVHWSVQVPSLLAVLPLYSSEITTAFLLYCQPAQGKIV
jgi:hypothetical protein